MSDPHTKPIPCASCGYNIRGVKIGDKCPECGTTISQYPIDQGSNGKSVAALVLGIVSIVTCMFWGLPSVICGPLAMMYAKKARLAVMAGEAPPSTLGLAKAGRICGIIGTILGAVYLVFMVLYMLFVLGVVGYSFWSNPGGGGGPLPLPTP